MATGVTTWRPTTASAVRRLLWALMAAAHFPGLIAAWRGVTANGLDADHLGGCLGLSLAMVFFALKIRDVAWLRFHPHLRSCVAVGIIVALLHVDVLRPDTQPTMVPEGTALMATAWVVGWMPVVRRVCGRLLRRSGTVPTQSTPSHRSAETVWLTDARPHCWLLAYRLFALRAPPV